MKQTVFITGSTDGIGKLAALRFVKEGHRVILHGRNPKKLAATLSEVKRASTNPDLIDGLVSDFSDLTQVATLARELKAMTDHIDILIHNAGIFHSPQAESTQGLDLRLAVNYLAPALLTDRILPLLKGGKVINLSSAAQAPVSLSLLKGEIQANAQQAYAQSKLALTMWSNLMAKMHPEMVFIAVNPGSLLQTKMVEEAFGQFWGPASKGADILFQLAQDQSVASGSYFDNDRGTFSQAHPDAYNEVLQKEVQKETELLLSAYIAG